MATTTENIILNIEIDGKSSISKIAALRKETDALKESNKQLSKEAKAALEAGATDVYEAKTKAIVQNDAAIKSLAATSRNYQNVLELQTKANVANKGSYEEALRLQQLAQINLKNLQGTLKKNADGTYELTDAYKAASKGVLQAKDAVLAFDAGIKDGRTNVGNYTQSFAAAIGQTGLFGDKLDILTQGFSKLKDGKKAASDLVSGLTGVGPAATTGASAMNLLKVAIASTGIGLLLIAVGSLAAYFSSTDEGANKLKVAFAAVGQVVDGLIGVFAKLGDFLLNSGKVFETLKNAVLNPIDAFNKATEATKEFALEQIKLAKIAMANAEAQIAYERSLIKTTATINEYNRQAEDYRVAAEDKTKTDKERIAFINEAAKLETLALKEKASNAAKEVQFAQSALDLKKASGSGIFEAEKELAAKMEVLKDAQDAVDDKALQTASESSKLRLALQKSEAIATIQILENTLKTKELSGEKDFELAKKIELKKYQELKAVQGQSQSELLALKSNYNLAIATIDKAAADEAVAAAEKVKAERVRIEDESIAAIQDRGTREIAEEAIVAQRKIESLVGTEQEKAAAKEAILLQSQENIKVIQAANDAEDLKRIEDLNAEKESLNQKELADKQKQAQALQALEQARLDVAQSVVSGLIQLLSQDEAARKKYGAALKALSIAEIVINLQKQLSAIAATTAGLGPFGIPLAAAQSIAAIINAGVRTALVANQKFAKGGVFGGNSHSNGGTKGYFSDGTAVEVERDEAFFVLNKRSTGMISNLSRLNQAGGGVRFAQGGTMRFSDGGYAANFAANNAFSNGDISIAIANLLENMPQPVVVVQDINEVQSRTAQVVERSVL